ncbi:Transposase [Wolbachia endosymbiont of Cylisticus convexus]|nr:Transposase [Wolbachia endosymbiont of Cylisticus convexus]
MGYRDIASHVEEIYDHKISAAEISSITDKLLPVINEWRGRPLQSVYPIVFMDGMFFKVKEDGHCISKCMYNILAKWQKRSFIWLKMRDWLGVLNDLKERYRLASQQKNYSSCIIKSKNTSDCVTVHRLQLVNMLNGLEAFFDFKLQSTS